MIPRRERRSLLIEVQVRERQELYMHRARNLSVGGIFVDAPLPLPVGTELELHFRLPGGGQVLAQGQVAWNGSEPEGLAGMGVSFTWLAPGAKDAIEAWLVAA